MTFRERYEKESGEKFYETKEDGGLRVSIKFWRWLEMQAILLESSLSKLTEENATLRAENERLKDELRKEKKEFSEYREEHLGINSPDPPED